MRFARRNSSSHELGAACGDGSGVAIAVVQREPDRPPQLLHCEYEKAESFASGLKALGRSARNKTTRWAGTVALGDYSLLLQEAADVPESEQRAAMRWKIQELIDYPVEDAIVDVFPAPPSRATGAAARQYVVAAKRRTVDDLVGAFMAAKLNVEAIDIPELAIRNVATLLPENVAGVATLMLGRNGGLMTLTRQDRLYFSRRVDIDLDLLLAAGEEGLDEPFQALLDAVVIEVQRSLDYYESHFAQPPCAGLMIAPLPRQVDGLTSYLQAQLGLPVHMIDLNTILDLEEEIPAPVQSASFPAIGAALREAAPA